jgi:hypothetical protein
MRFSHGVDPVFMKGQAQFAGQITGKGQIAVRFLAAKAMVKVGGMKHQAQFAASFVEGAQQGHGIRTTRQADG